MIPPFSKFSSENEKWSLYSERLECYFVACGITDDTDKKNYFLAWCGENLFATLTSLFDPVKLKDPSIEYQKIISKLDSQFKEDVNIMSATYNLYMCKQNLVNLQPNGLPNSRRRQDIAVLNRVVSLLQGNVLHVILSR